MTGSSPSALPLAQFAAARGLSVRQVRLRLAKGAPAQRRGRLGRGHVTLIELAAWDAWERGQMPLELAGALRRDVLVEAADLVSALLAALLHRQGLLDVDPDLKAWRAERLLGAVESALIDGLRDLAGREGLPLPPPRLKVTQTCHK